MGSWNRSGPTSPSNGTPSLCIRVWCLTPSHLSVSKRSRVPRRDLKGFNLKYSTSCLSLPSRLFHCIREEPTTPYGSVKTGYHHDRPLQKSRLFLQVAYVSWFHTRTVEGWTILTSPVRSGRLRKTSFYGEPRGLDVRRYNLRKKGENERLGEKCPEERGKEGCVKGQ